MYFCIDDYSDAAFVITNFGMYSFFYEYGATEKDANVREDYLHCIEMCRDNLETALANLNILMPANQESIMALALGVSSPFSSCLLFSDTHPPEFLLTNAGYACPRDF